MSAFQMLKEQNKNLWSMTDGNVSDVNQKRLIDSEYGWFVVQICCMIWALLVFRLKSFSEKYPVTQNHELCVRFTFTKVTERLFTYLDAGSLGHLAEAF